MPHNILHLNMPLSRFNGCRKGQRVECRQHENPLEVYQGQPTRLCLAEWIPNDTACKYIFRPLKESNSVHTSHIVYTHQQKEMLSSMLGSSDKSWLLLTL